MAAMLGFLYYRAGEVAVAQPAAVRVLVPLPHPVWYPMLYIRQRYRRLTHLAVSQSLIHLITKLLLFMRNMEMFYIFQLSPQV